VVVVTTRGYGLFTIFNGFSFSFEDAPHINLIKGILAIPALRLMLYK
jgi:hypothetical protein